MARLGNLASRGQGDGEHGEVGKPRQQLDRGDGEQDEVRKPRQQGSREIDGGERRGWETSPAVRLGS